jgi:hemin uptake protein HemP
MPYSPSPALSLPRAGADAPAPASPSVPVRLDSRALFAGRNVVLIRHAEQDYVLRLTRNGKLILTK